MDHPDRAYENEPGNEFATEVASNADLAHPEGEQGAEIISETPSGEHLDHALAFYSATLDAYAKTPEGPGRAEAVSQWETANAEMCEFAIDMQDLALASQSYNYMHDPVKKWGLVAKVHEAGYPIVALDWKAPLLQAVEQGKNTMFDSLAMYKAMAAMSFDNVPHAVDDEDRRDKLREVEAAWQDAHALIKSQRGKELAPRRPNTNRNPVSNLPPELDARSHMLDFAKLFAEHGDFAKSAEILAEIKYIHDEVTAYGDLDYSYDAGQSATEFAGTLEIRELSYGFDEKSLRKHAKSWSEEGYQPTTRELSRLIVDPHDTTSTYDHPAGVREGRLFLEDTYPGLALGRDGVAYEHVLDVSLKHGDWEEALNFYDHNLYISHDNSELLHNALLIARYEREIAESDVTVRGEADIAAIHGIAARSKIELLTDDTVDLPATRLAGTEQLNKYLGKRYAVASQQIDVFRALLVAQKEIDPTNTAVQPKIKQYTEQRLEALSKIPDAENAIPEQLAAVRQLAAEAGVK